MSFRFVADGRLVPDDLMLEIVGGELNRLKSADRSWLLDGFPRTKPQALRLFKMAPVQVVISLDVPFDVIIDRVKGQCADIEYRISSHHSLVAYRSMDTPPKRTGL